MKKYKLRINGEDYEAKILSYSSEKARVNVNGIDYEIAIEQENVHLSEPIIKSEKSYINPEPVHVKVSSNKKIIAPIPGLVMNVHKKVGDIVNKGDVVFTIEAMKMESELIAQASGKITAVNTEKGKTVLEGDVLAEIESGEQVVESAPSKMLEGKKSPTVVSAKRSNNISAVSDRHVRAPIPGTVLDIKVKMGDIVMPDDVVVILEAMKMESEIRAGSEGRVLAIKFGKGESVQENDVLIEIGEAGK